MPASLASATAFCTEYLWELKRRPDIIGHRHRMTAHTDLWLWCTSMVLLLAAWLELPCTAGQKAVKNHALGCRNDPKTVQKRPAVTDVTAVTPGLQLQKSSRLCTAVKMLTFFSILMQNFFIAAMHSTARAHHDGTIHY